MAEADSVIIDISREKYRRNDGYKQVYTQGKGEPERINTEQNDSIAGNRTKNYEMKQV